MAVGWPVAWAGALVGSVAEGWVAQVAPVAVACAGPAWGTYVGSLLVWEPEQGWRMWEWTTRVGVRGLV